MMLPGEACLGRRAEPLIRPFGDDALEKASTVLNEAAARLDKPGLADPATPLFAFLGAALSLSPYLLDTCRSDPSVLTSIDMPVAAQLDALILEAREAWREGDGNASEAQLMSRLRRAKRHFAFLAALADLDGLWPAERTTSLLSRFAEAAVASAMDHLLRAANDAGEMMLAHPDRPSLGSGVVVLGMGKLGAGELNYSSDIDVVVFFSPDCPAVPDADRSLAFFPRMMRRFVRILQERTGDGYVFRTDLRLRPDPGSTALAVPVEAALVYYESRGQNWERAAYIKAKPIAGDLAAGETFIREMTPFIFRKYLDYAAIADIHAIKRQIHAHKGFGLVAVNGHNVKLGRGGIREIEFFVQTQQLIAGGRMPQLRQRRTIDALEALREARWIDGATCDELSKAYWFLRNVEHRIQMVRDEQTHVLPEGDDELLRIAFMLGFEGVNAFAEALLKTLKTVEKRYARLFEREETLSSETGNLVFTGEEDDPSTLETLSHLGFERPSDISRIIRSWHYGRYRATQSTKARQRLTALMPALLKAFGESRRADEALLRFDRFLSGLPAGVQLFSLLTNNTNLLRLVVEIMSAAPRMAEILAARPHILDGMLDPALLTELPTRDYLSSRLEAFMSGATLYEERLDRLRIFAAEQRFLIGIRLMTGAINGFAAGYAFTTLATLAIGDALEAAEAEMEAAHGRVAGQRVAVLAMGKLGSAELTAGSDVDVIVLYDCDDPLSMSDGEKPLDVTRYFARLTQRLVAALSAPTAEGVLYEVDMRLRPSGNAGPLATRLAAFEKYQKNEAWTWEHMALSRSHPLCGDASLLRDAGAVIDDVLSKQRDPKSLAFDVADMRARIGREKPAKSLWDLKLVDGGLIDIEFLAQYSRLSACDQDGGKTGDRDILSTDGMLEQYGELIMSFEDVSVCRNALRLYTDLSQLTRACLPSGFDPEAAPSALVERVCRIADQPDIGMVEALLKDTGEAVRSIFLKTLSV
ncbi:bifunctional [glutamine synthetase] adenylyltransferase/[glutamine synthetase]-adenylyl-L-tyrosine phosphorylase [Martelella alba]|uniref:Bifunctional glutamine synthetase adenylyltransferase/adenylyl-removing enzyme n=1 Tax=Martelella alba TaxID=2590451 RepID=A0A506UCE0_9HYPH|nr:bifunctional [glutamine synthetase] adenylyltransferase/[glutamine synthetase]-adenylyl-L-tyrosine phosphorylase [Martelella alba]TPW29427.1 bifunctional [glutamine synthetase] adenylyltransferase/[glutamine synthetase]-adenylyl-L-tyrosine phosphorylase [Martelella alba]